MRLWWFPADGSAELHRRFSTVTPLARMGTNLTCSEGETNTGPNLLRPS